MALTVCLVAGLLVLGYGFTNVVFHGDMLLIPLAEIMLAPLVLAAALGRSDWKAPARIVVPVVAYLLVVMLRLMFDYPVWHSLAVRDSSIAVEITAVVVGYRALARDGIQVWLKWFERIFIAVLVYGSLWPLNDWFAAHSPTVGYDRPIPLFSPRLLGSPAVLAAFAFFAIYTRGWRRTVLMAWAVALMGVFQERGEYLALALVVLLLGWALGRPTAMWARTIGALAFAVVILSLAAALGVSGRLGRITPDFYFKHAATLTGANGPGAGSFSARQTLAKKTLHEFASSPTTVTFGVGLGRDLGFGLPSPIGTSLRKPHDDYLETLARTGIVGFSIFVVMLWSLLAPLARRAFGRGDEIGRFCIFLLAATCGYLAVAATEPLLSFSYATIPVFFWFGMGAAAAAGRVRRDDSSRR